MRSIITISVPPSVKKSVNEIMKEGKYASTSEFFRDALRSWKKEQLYQSVLKSEQEFATGKGKRLRSLKDLM